MGMWTVILPLSLPSSSLPLSFPLLPLPPSFLQEKCLTVTVEPQVLEDKEIEDDKSYEEVKGQLVSWKPGDERKCLPYDCIMRALASKYDVMMM